MGIADELQKLDELRRGGTLSDEEFAKAKTRLLETPPPVVNVGLASGSPFVEEQLTEVRYQNELARIDREWEIDCRRYELVGRKGRLFIPTIGVGISTAVVGVLFGLFLAFVGRSITEPMAEFDVDARWILMAERILPLFGVLWAVIAIAKGVYYCVVAHNFNSAYAAYRSRREKVMKA